MGSWELNNHHDSDEVMFQSFLLVLRLSLSVIATGDQINPSDTSRKLVVCLDFSEITQIHNSATYRRKVRSF